MVAPDVQVEPEFHLQELRGAHSNQACAWMNDPIRLRQRGTSFYLFHEHVAL